MFNLFYIESPLQILSAIEAAKKFNERKAILIVGLSKGDRVNNDLQIEELVDSFCWERIFYIEQKSGRWRNFFTLYNSFKYSFLYKGKVDKYFFGEYRSLPMALLGVFLKPNDFVLMDDGSFTITAQNFYIRNGVFPYARKTLFKLFKKKFDSIRIPDLFSFYKLKLIGGQVNYYELPKKIEVEIDKGVAFFFGSKFSESKTMSFIDELLILEEVKNKYKSYKFFYIPHRDESKNKLDEISNLGFFVKKLGGPAEVYFDSVSIMPEMVFSYYSTVLYSCYIRFENVKLISVNVYGRLKNRKARLNAKEIYKYYDEISIPILCV